MSKVIATYHDVTVTKVVDGDTFDAYVTIAPTRESHIRATIRVRLYGVDTPEKGHEDWAAAKQFTEAWLNRVEAPCLTLREPGTDSFGRWLCDAFTPGAFLNDPPGEYLADQLLIRGLATEYKG